MSQEAHGYVGNALEMLKKGLTSFVEARLESKLTGHWKIRVLKRIPPVKNLVENGEIAWDVYFLLKTMMVFWSDAFSDLKHPARSYVGELYATRNDWAHQRNFTHEDANRAIDTIRRLLQIIGKNEIVVEEVLEELDRLREKIKPVMPEEDNSASPLQWKSYDLKVG